MNLLKFVSREPKLGFKDVLVVPCQGNNINEINQCSQGNQSNQGNNKNIQNNKVNLFTTFPFYLRKNKKIEWRGIPIVSSNIDSVTDLNTFNILKESKYISCFPSYLNEYFIKEFPEELRETEYYILSCGLNDYYLACELIVKLKKEFGIDVKFLSVNIPNGYITELQDITLMIRESFPELIIIAGNVLNADITYDLIKYSGVNIVKCGLLHQTENIEKTLGIGYPMLSGLLECSHAAHEAGGYLMSNCGISGNPDGIPDGISKIVKSFAAGADFVMVDGILEGHKESPPNICPIQGIKEINKEINIQKPMLKTTISKINRSLKRACEYVNASDLDEFYLNSRFVKIK